MTAMWTAARPKPVASFVVEPQSPARDEPVRLVDLSYDPAGEGIALHAWDLGDGTTSADADPTHRYARDGVYLVTLHVTSRDGRIGTTSLPIAVTTHDIAVTRVDAPSRARAGESGMIVVEIESRHGAETCLVELHRSNGAGSHCPVSVQTGVVPRTGSGRLSLSFPVTWDECQGRVLYEARARIVGALDATPADNTMTVRTNVVR